MMKRLLPAAFAFLSPVFFILVLLISLAQFAALYSFFADYWGWYMIFAGFAALIIAGIPWLSAILGTIGAYCAWGWELWEAIGLMCAPAIFWLALALLNAVISCFSTDSKDQDSTASEPQSNIPAPPYQDITSSANKPEQSISQTTQEEPEQSLAELLQPLSRPSLFDRKLFLFGVNNRTCLLEDGINQYQEQYETEIAPSIELESNKRSRLTWKGLLNEGLPIIDKAKKLYQAEEDSVIHLNQVLDAIKEEATDEQDISFYIQRALKYRDLSLTISQIFWIYDELRTLSSRASTLSTILEAEIQRRESQAIRSGYKAPENIMQLLHDLHGLSKLYLEKSEKRPHLEWLRDEAAKADSDIADQINACIIRTGNTYRSTYRGLIKKNDNPDKMPLIQREWQKVITDISKAFDDFRLICSNIILSLESCEQEIYVFGIRDPMTLALKIDSLYCKLDEVYINAETLECFYEIAEDLLQRIEALITTQKEVAPNSSLYDAELIKNTIANIELMKQTTRVDAPKLHKQITDLNLKLFKLRSILPQPPV